jgi:hypothetical protein
MSPNEIGETSRGNELANDVLPAAPDTHSTDTPHRDVSAGRAAGVGSLDVFTAGSDGQIYAAWFRAVQGWKGWTPDAILPAGVALRPAPAAVVSGHDPATGGPNLDVFTASSDGRIFTAWYRPGPGWNGWKPVATKPAGVKLQPAPASVVGAQNPGIGVGNLDLFTAGSDGRIYTAWWRPGQGWQGWKPVASATPGVKLQPAPAAVIF